MQHFTFLKAFHHTLQHVMVKTILQSGQDEMTTRARTQLHFLS